MPASDHLSASSVPVAPTAESLRLITGRGMLIFLAITQLAVLAAVWTGMVGRIGQLLEAPEPWMADVGFTLIVMSLTGAVILASRHNRQAVAATMRLAWLAGNDALTGLPSRRALDEDLGERLARGGPNGRAAVFVIDIDGMAAVNEAHGPDVGDQILRAVGVRLGTVTSLSDLLVRYNGDEFVLVAGGINDIVEAEARASALHGSLDVPIRAGNHSITLTASIGVAVAEERCERPNEVLDDAMAANARARDRGPGSTVVYDRARPDQLPPSSAARRLAESVAEKRFVLHYQPVVTLPDRRLVGVESLIRWDDPASGLLRPSEFFNTLRSTGLMVQVGRWAIEEACRQGRMWSDAHPDQTPLNVTVNVSAAELNDPEFTDHLKKVITTTGVDPDSIYLEVDEQTLAHAGPQAWTALQGARAIGVHIAVDDFGATIGPVTALLRLRPELVKIDRVVHKARDAAARDAVAHLVELAHALGSVVLAEGVEDNNQVEWLARLGVDLGQGYHLATPQPADQIDQLLRATAGGGSWGPLSGRETVLSG